MWENMETPGIVYDLETSGGLMEQIQTLLAPPKSEEGDKRSPRKPERDARRGGRATNHDACDSCREGGDLLCCDHCPAAFHLQCCNPPLREEVLPPGDWMCHRCVVRRKKREQKEQINGLLDQQQRQNQQHPSSSPEAGLQLGVGGPRVEAGLQLGVAGPRVEAGLQLGVAGPRVEAGLRATVSLVRLPERLARSRPASPASSASTDTPTPSDQNDADQDLLEDAEEEEEEEEDEEEGEAPGSEPESSASSSRRLKRPFDLLIAAALERNPTQFQLPGDLACTDALPGSGKRRRKEEETERSARRPQHELDHNGPVPMPGKVCFYCSRGCRLAPLVQCDYCPLLFHMDCVSAPVAAMPTGKWMCPNHSEILALHQRSSTPSNRCQLFDRFQDRMSQHAVKVDFLQRAHRQSPPNGRGTPTLRRALRVPDGIKTRYQCPPPGAVAPAGIRDGELICDGVPDPLRQRRPPQHFTSEAEQQEWLRDIIALQCSIVRHLSTKQTTPPPSSRPAETEKAGGARPSAGAERTAPPEASASPSSSSSGPQGAPVRNSPRGPAPPPPEERRGCGSCAEAPCQSCAAAAANGPLEPPARSGRPSLPGRAPAELQRRLGGGPLGPLSPHIPPRPGPAPVQTPASAPPPAPPLSPPAGPARAWRRGDRRPP